MATLVWWRTPDVGGWIKVRPVFQLCPWLLAIWFKADLKRAVAYKKDMSGRAESLHLILFPFFPLSLVLLLFKILILGIQGESHQWHVNLCAFQAARPYIRSLPPTDLLSSPLLNDVNIVKLFWKHWNIWEVMSLDTCMLAFRFFLFTLCNKYIEMCLLLCNKTCKFFVPFLSLHY